MSSIIPVVRKEELAALPTKALLGRLKRLHACEESLGLSDRSSEGTADVRVGQIEFKDTPVWLVAYAEVKDALAGREHVPHKPERQTARVAKAKKNRTSERKAFRR